MPKYVYDFIEGDRSRADLLGGKGANLAEMTRLGLPVPPGFTISTDACRAYLAAGSPPAGLFAEVNAAPAGDRGPPGPVARRPPRPAAAGRPLRRAVLDARDDGDDPGHRAQRRHRRRARGAQRRRTLRVGLVPPADPDVRSHRVRGAERRVRAGAGGAAGHGRGGRAERRAAARPGGDVQEDLRPAGRARLPAGPARAAPPGRPLGLRVVERGARPALPAAGAHPRRPGHRGQRDGDGLRQPGAGLRHRGGVHPRPGHRRARGVRRLPGRRPGRGRGGRHPQHRRPARAGTARPGQLPAGCWRSWPHWNGTTGTCATSSSPSNAAGCGCCRPGSASAPRRPPS